ncbi:hypothetical protein J6590_081021 [Homalodisca vitripennis]|nr:hypothetical protein J6590_081021 [Homalodisca vitripennis]
MGSVGTVIRAGSNCYGPQLMLQTTHKKVSHRLLDSRGSNFSSPELTLAINTCFMTQPRLHVSRPLTFGMSRPDGVPSPHRRPLANSRLITDHV